MTIVYDSWWPWRFGRIIRTTKTRTVVRWDDGKVWTYDKAHLEFLRRGSDTGGTNGA